MDSGSYGRAYRRGTIFGLTIAEILILLLFTLLLLFLPLIVSGGKEGMAAAEADRLHQELEKKKQELEKSQDLSRNAYKELEVLTQEVQALRRANAEGQQELKHQEAERKDIESKLEVLQERDDNLATENSILKVKGQNPPCWYEVVSTSSGEKREKAHYIFNVAVFDEFIDVRLRKPSEGGAVDDGGISYSEELPGLGLADVPFGTKMSDEDFVRHFRPLSWRGKNAQVRTYSCIFSISIWDQTSPDAKPRWKRANGQILQGLFGTYLVKDTPWPYPPL